MFDVGILELFIVAIIALLVLGPERLPKAAQQAGRWLGQAKRTMGHWSSEINRQIDNEELAKKLGSDNALGSVNKELFDLNESISQSLGGKTSPENDLPPARKAG